MGQMKAWGMKLFEVLERHYMETGSKEKAIELTFEDYKGQVEDHEWLKRQIDYAWKNPEIFGGHESGHWQRLRQARREAAGRKGQIRSRGDYGG